MPSNRSIYRVLASLVILTFVFIAPFGTVNAIGARAIVESRTDSAVSAPGILDLPAAEPPDPPVSPDPLVPDVLDEPLSLDAWDPTQPMPLSLEEKFKIQEQFEVTPTGEILPEQLPPALEPEHFPQMNPGLTTEPVQEPMDSSLSEGMQVKVDANTPEITLPEGMNIQGSLVDADGAAQVNAIIRAASESGDFYTETLTDTQGRFAFLNLPAADYRLLARSMDGTFLTLQDSAFSQVNAREVIAPLPHALTLQEEVIFDLDQTNGLSSQPPVLKTETLPVVTLLGTGTITGRVTKTGGIPLEGVLVHLYTSTYAWVTYTYTDNLGFYWFSGLDANNYIVAFSCDTICDPDYLADEFYNDKFTIESADLVPVADDATTAGINATLEPSGRISGTVTSVINLSPMPNVDVCAENLAQTLQLCGITDINGGYTLPYLPSDTYTVYFYPYNGYAPLYYNQKSTREAADPVTVTWGQVTSNINAQLGPSQYISGRVTSEVDGTPIYSMIYAIPISGGYFSNTWTDAGGYYNLTGMEPGFYRIQFLPQDLCDESGCQPTEYLSEYYNGKSVYALGDVLAVTADSMHTNIDATLQKGAFITGNVKASDGSTPLEGINVHIHTEGGSSFWAAQTDVDGNYRTTPLQPGTYRIEFNTGSCSSPCAEHLSEYYDNASILENAAPVVVPAQTTVSGIDAALALGGSISGTVIDSGSTNPIEGVWVYIQDDPIYRSGYTDTNGVYRIPGLPNGSYTVQFVPPSSYVAEYYNNKYNSSTADPVEVIAPNEVTGIDAAMSVGGGISGLVTDSASGLGIGNISVHVSNSGFFTNTWTNSSGEYNISGLPLGAYTVYFSPQDGLHVGEYYNNKLTSTEADPVNITPPSVVSGINAALSTGGEISGTVTSALGAAPLEGIGVILYKEMNPTWWWYSSTKTDAQGKYHFTGLSTGNYLVNFDPGYDCPTGCANDSYIGEYYNDKHSFDTADSIPVTAGQLTTNIDAVLEPGGTMSGQVTDEDTGLPLANIQVALSSSSYYRSQNTNEEGNYSISGIPSGTYRVSFETWNNTAYAQEYYNNKTSYSAADLVTITAPEFRTGIDAALAKSVSLSGQVISDVDDLPLVDVDVHMSLVDGDGWVTSTDSEGYYSFSGRQVGTYRLRFDPTDSEDLRTRDHMTEYYKDAVYQDDATLITLAAGQNATNYDASLAIGAKITGQVTATDGGLPIPNVWVEAYILDENGSRDYQSDTHTDEAGNYSLHGLPGGEYYVYFRPSDTSDYVAESYNNKIYWKDGDLITVPDQATVNNINASLETGRHIRGTLSSASTGLPITDWFYISIYDDDGDWRAYAYLDASGQYLSSALPPGKYTLYYNTNGMDPEIAQYLGEYYNDRPTRLTAKFLNVGIESDTIAENVSLDLAGQISGRVTSQTSSLGIGNVRIEYSNLNYRYYYWLSDSVYSDADGSYTIPYLEPGEYSVCFYPSGEYASTCITSVKVAIGSYVENVDAAVESGGRISGQVTADGALIPLADVYVQIYDTEGNFYNAAVTSLTGDYISEPLPEGNYKVEFYPSASGSAAAYVSEYYNNHTDWDLANLVAVTSGSTTTDIDASLALGASISGRVTAAATGLPVEDVYATLYSISDQYISYERSVMTNAEGYYTLAGIKNGNYKISFEVYAVNNLLNEWYNNQPSPDSADPITVTGMVDITGIDASLEPGGYISGTVTDNFGNPLEGASILAISVGSGYYHNWGSTDANGFYMIDSLATGSYEITFEKYRYAREIYGGFDAPVPVPVTTGSVTPNIDMVLERGSVIAGWVNGSDTGEPEWAMVYMYNESGNEVATTFAENPRGYYEQVLSPDKAYRIQFTPYYYGDTNYTNTYYQNKDSLETADSVWLPANDVVYPVDGNLPLGGNITGQVTSETDVPLQDVLVIVYDSSDSITAGTLTDVDGNFTTSGLGAGNYRVYFDPTYYEIQADYLPEYYADKPDLATADLVAVTAGATTSGINARLAKLVPATASFESNAQNFGEAVGSVNISLSLDTASPVAVTVPFTVGGYAAPGVDHTLQNGAFQFAPGETVDTVTFDVINDPLDELDETIILTLVDPINAQLGAITTHTITIMDDDLPIIVLPAPVVSQVSPPQGTAQTPGTVVIYGSNFSTGAVATFKLEPASVSLSTTYQSDSQLYATVPAGLPEGPYTLEVTNPDGKTGSLLNAYQVLPAITDDLFANTYDLWSDPATVYSGTSVSVGLVVGRQGGDSILATISVDFYLGDPASGGVKIGSDSISNLAGGDWGSTSGLVWNTPIAGEYTLFAVIDPANEIPETIESNNVISRKITVLVEPDPDSDLTPPSVTSFTVNQGNPDTSSTSIPYSVSASDNPGGIGVFSAMVIEYDFFESINQWVQVKATDWLPYSAFSVQNFELLETPGAKYLQVWVADGAGNVSLEPKTVFINYIPATDSLLKGQSRYYVYSLGQAQEFNTTVTPLWGDPDLYIWAPDFYSRSPWMSLSSTSQDSVTLITPVECMYVVQIYGFSNSGFEFTTGQQSLTIASGETLAVDLLVSKEPLSEPGLEPGDIPSNQRGIQEAPQGTPVPEYKVFLPMIKR